MEDDVGGNTTDEEKGLNESTRSKTTIAFVRSFECGRILALGGVTSIHRLACARALASKGKGDEKPYGITRECRDIYDLTMYIIGGA